MVDSFESPITEGLANVARKQAELDFELWLLFDVQPEPIMPRVLLDSAAHRSHLARSDLYATWRLMYTAVIRELAEDFAAHVERACRPSSATVA